MTLSKSEIMKAAWYEYRSLRSNYTPAQIAASRIDASFSGCLKHAWKMHKLAAARIAKERAEALHVNASRIAAMKQAIDELKFKPFGHHIAAERRALEAELSALAV